MSRISEKTVIIILAAGKGTRMKSEKAKVLHEINGKPMINFVVDAAKDIVGDNIVVVVGHQKEEVKECVLGNARVRFAVQNEQLGTGHAVICAMPEVPDDIDSVVILCGDVPLISSETLSEFLSSHKQAKADLTVLSVKVNNPTGYGRLVVNDKNEVLKIVEEADADADEKEINLINSGIYCVGKDFLNKSLSGINSDNSQSELYLTDIVGIGYNDNKIIRTYISENSSEVIGVNTIQDLNEAKRLITALK